MRFIMLSALFAFACSAAAIAGPSASELHAQTLFQQAYAAKHPGWPPSPQASDGARATAKFKAAQKAAAEKQ